MSWISRLANVFRGDRLNDDLDEELEFHLAEKAKALMAAGMSASDAVGEARRRLGNTLVTRERSRDVKLLPWLDALLGDVRFGLRMLRKDRAVTLAAILSLGLAMGASIAAFALIDALILLPLPVSEPHRLIYLAFPRFIETGEQADQLESAWFSYPFFERVRQVGHGRVALFGVSYQGTSRIVFPDLGEQEEKVYLQYVSGNAFGDLGIVPAKGRLLSPSDDDRPGAHPVAVVSHGYWMRRFGGDPKVVGRWFTRGHTSFQIIGVTQQGFAGVEPGVRTDVWMPMTMWNRPVFDNGGWSWFRIMGRLAPGVDIEQARALAQPVFTSFLRDRVREFPRTNRAIASSSSCAGRS